YFDYCNSRLHQLGSWASILLFRHIDHAVGVFTGQPQSRARVVASLVGSVVGRRRANAVARGSLSPCLAFFYDGLTAQARSNPRIMLADAARLSRIRG